MPTVSMDQLVDAICNLTLLEAAELTKTLEDKLGVSAAAPMMAMAMPGAGPAVVVEEEKTTFDVELTSLKPEANKVQVIKVVREFTTLGLKEAKELVDGAPKIVKEGTTKEDADKMKARFEEVQAVITIK